VAAHGFIEMKGGLLLRQREVKAHRQLIIVGLSIGRVQVPENYKLTMKALGRPQRLRADQVLHRPCGERLRISMLVNASWRDPAKSVCIRI
jgi:hypothetical protein